MSGDTWHTELLFHSELLFPASPSSSPSSSHQRNEDLIDTRYWLDSSPGVPLPHRPQIHIVDYNLWIALASDNGGGPRSRWILRDRDGSWSWWWILIVMDPDLDGGSWSWTLITTRLLRSSSITDINPSVLWPSVILQSVSMLLKPLSLWCPLLHGTSIHLCPSWETGPHVCLWGFYLLHLLGFRTEDVSPC